ncbi:hypothetical protein C8R46DRAFT_1324569 [Mycena filopes]|nr:hypothetical protein C8R46DRAFT_1324569 [Mycena filopes]
MTTSDAGNRWRLLTNLHEILDNDEETAEILLKAFDLSLHDCDSNTQNFLTESPPSTQTPMDPDHSRQAGTEIGSSSCQNPFLSTPMRLKHFSRLSPSILRDLLRSPSLRTPSLCDDSLDSASNSNDLSSPQFPVSAWRLNKSPPANFESDLQSRRPSLPLTPPPSARIPFSTQLSNYTPGKRWTLCLSNVFLTCFPAFRRQEIAHVVRTLPSTTQPNSLVSPSAVRNFQRVIDEMRGMDSAREVTRRSEDDSFLSLSSDQSIGGDFEATSNIHNISHDSPPMNQTLETLEDEFVNLLQERAAEEEEDAKELRALADRLERIAKGRRRLAVHITERKDEQQKLE